MRYGTHVILLVYATGEVGQGWLQTSTEAVSRMGCSLRKKGPSLAARRSFTLAGGRQGFRLPRREEIAKATLELYVNIPSSKIIRWFRSPSPDGSMPQGHVKNDYARPILPALSKCIGIVLCTLKLTWRDNSKPSYSSPIHSHTNSVAEAAVGYDRRYIRCSRH